MQQEHPTLGKLLLHGKASVARMVRRVILFMLPAVFLGVIGIIGLIDPYLMAMEDEPWVVPVVLGAAALYVILMFFFVKPYEVAVYENGFAWKRRGNNIREWGFGNILVSDIIETTTYGFIPVSKVRNLTITPIDKAAAAITLTRNNTPNFHNFADLLQAEQYVYQTKNMTPENVFEVTMDFGNELILENGKFLHRKGHRKEKFAFLKDVKTVNVFNDTVTLAGAVNEFGKAEELLKVTGAARHNIPALYHIVELAGKKA